MNTNEITNMTDSELTTALNRWTPGEIVPESDIALKAALDAEWNRRAREVIPIPELTAADAESSIRASNAKLANA